jgi:hypothetical protein
LPSVAWAILIRAGEVPVSGYFVRDDGKTLTIRVRTPDGKEETKAYDRAKIKIVIVSDLDRKRLEKLSPDNPKAYGEYAEELAGQEGDPEASDMAMRLFLIAAYLDPQKLGHRSLLRMSRLASTPAEARKCRAMAFLLDPKAEASVLKAEAGKPAALPKAQASALQEFLKALQDFRAGQVKAASLAAKRQGVDKIFDLAPGMIDQKAFLQRCADASCATCKSKGKVLCPVCNGRGAVGGDFGRPEPCTTCKGQKTVTCTDCDGTGVHQAFADDIMRTLLRAELWALGQLSGSDGGSKRDAGEVKWSAILQDRQVSPVAPLSLETITELDPRKCLYRKGTAGSFEWVAP